MFTVSETITIERPRAEVFDFLIDGRNRPRWDSSVVFVQLTDTANEGSAPSPPPIEWVEYSMGG